MTQTKTRRVIFSGETKETDVNQVIKPIQEKILRKQRRDYEEAQHIPAQKKKNAER